MTRGRLLLGVLVCGGWVSGQEPTLPVVLESPSSTMSLTFTLSDSGRPTYSLYLEGDTVVAPSGMGLELFGDTDFVNSDAPTDSLYDNFELNTDDEEGPFSRASKRESWTPVWGEEDEIWDIHNELLVRLVQKDDRARKMNIRFRLFDDGLGFRYEFPAQANLTYYHVKEERTQFAMTGDHHAWWIPGDYDTQEWQYTASRLSYIRYLHDAAVEDNVSSYPFSVTGVQTALQLKTDDGIYINIHEAALVNYSCMHLDLDDTNMIFESHLTPDAVGVKAHLQAPNITPWRTVIASRDATKILASRITYNLNEPPSSDVNWSEWVKPIKFMGVWWEMITGYSRWDYTFDLPSVQLGVTQYDNVTPHKLHGANTTNVLEYLKFAAEHKMDALLIEGWNIGWEDWFGNWKDYVFDFVTPYPDFDLERIKAYAKEVGVELMMHHETSGSTRNYERHLHDAYQFMADHGYKSVKSGYVGNMLPHGNHHYSQDMVNHYLYCVQEAVKYKISVNAHEAVRPTGLARTYPNMIAHEAARGQEYTNNYPHHLTILPFTRQIGGPMDYTPGVMNMDLGSWVNTNNANIQSTIAKQLALYVTMYSPLQMAADTWFNYEPHVGRGFNFIEDVPVEWKRSVYIEAEPGSYVTIARLDKHSDNWFLGSIANEDPRYVRINLDFLEEGVYYEGKVYYDTPTAHYANNPHAYDIRDVVVTKGSKLLQWVASGGGFAASFKKIASA